MPKANDIVALVASWRGRFIYTNDTRRRWPLKYDAADCSSMINAAYRQILGETLGERSFNIALNPHLITVAKGTSLRGKALDNLIEKLQPGDIICMGWQSGYYHSSGISHVELYAGGGYTWGHGGPGKGPNRVRLSWWLGNSRVFVVKRHPKVGAGVQAPPATLPGKGTGALTIPPKITRIGVPKMILIHRPKTTTQKEMYALAGPDFWLEFSSKTTATEALTQYGVDATPVEANTLLWKRARRAAKGK